MKIRYIIWAILFCILVFVVGLIAGRIWLRPEVRSEPGGIKVVENPMEKQASGANALIREKSLGKVSGNTTLNPNQHHGEPVTVTIPVSGLILTTYVDERTGETIGTGEHPITGETEIKLDEAKGKVKTETRIEGQTVVGVFIPERAWMIEAGLNGAAVELRKRLFRELYGVGKVEYCGEMGIATG